MQTEIITKCIHIFSLTHLVFSFLRSSSSCSACFLLQDRINNQTQQAHLLSLSKNHYPNHIAFTRKKKKNTHWGALLTAHRHCSHLCSSIICNFSFIFLSLSSASLRSFKTLSFSRRRLSSAARLLSSSFLSSSSRWHTHTHTRETKVEYVMLSLDKTQLSSVAC